MKLLITGANGQLGQALIAACKAQGVDYIATTRVDFDIRDLAQVSSALTQHRVQLVVNTAAYTAVDQAESHASDAYGVNELGAKHLAIACKNLGLPLIHISTDYVFSGDANIAYLPTAHCAPHTVYGASKLAGEQAIASILPAHVIIRTAWLYSEYGSNFAKTMLRLANERESISVVDDQIGCPTYAPDLAAVILAVAEKMLEANWPHFGVYHFVGNEVMSWCQFAMRIMSIREALTKQTCLIHAIPSHKFPTAAKRPSFSVLDSRSLWQDFALQHTLTPFNQTIERIIRH